MKQFISFIIKEAKHIVRDKRTMLILFGMPIIMMLLFGYAVRNDVRNVRTVIVMSNTDYVTQQAVDRLSASEYFTITQLVATPVEAEQAIRDQKGRLGYRLWKGLCQRTFRPSIHCRRCRPEYGATMDSIRQCRHYESE